MAAVVVVVVRSSRGDSADPTYQIKKRTAEVGPVLELVLLESC